MNDANQTSADSGERYFGPELFGFLRDLANHNERGWFRANRARYDEHVRDAAFEFIAAFSHPLHQISREFEAIPKAVGGSLYRIHRDVRFSRDKSPYKTHVGIHFRHREHRSAHAPGFYLHLEPRNCFAGVGIWRPDSDATRAIREAIASDVDRWDAAVSGEFADQFELAGESLVRAPRGFDLEHARIEHLKRKSFIGVHSLTQAEVTSSSFLGDFVALCEAGAPLNRFLSEALGVDF